MKPNIGRIDALCRITMGFTILAWSTSKLVKRPNDNVPLFAAVCGSMKAAEGITRFCPLTYLAEQKMETMQDHACHHDSHSE
ncbi:YgaP family membrane protein [Halalkalibacter flavus]|uniref:YgaP family membrane protein n=1 Tax=Halalkalibacter flavus TaxID=3090668 RepID=UPI002FC66547